MSVTTGFDQYQTIQGVKNRLKPNVRAILRHCDIMLTDTHLVIITYDLNLARRLNKKAESLSRITRSSVDLGLIIRSGKRDFNDLVID